MNNIQFDQEAFDKLTPREIEAARLVADGFTAKEVGQAMSISTRTAQAHMNAAIEKLNRRNSAHVATTLVRGGII